MTIIPESKTLPAYNLTRAKPNAVESTPWGTAAEIPNSHGIFVAYVPDLNRLDYQGVPSVIRRYFFGSLGTNMTTANERYHRMVTAWGIIVRSDAGGVLSHLAKCIDIGLPCQSRIFPIFENGIYEGCILCGTGFTVATKERVWEPISYKHIQEVLRAASLTSVLLETVSGMIGEQCKDVRSMRGLAKLVRKAVLNTDQRDEIEKIAHQLNFPQKWWPINASTIRKALLLLEHHTEPDDDVAMHPSALFSRDHTTSVLSAFGYHAPTFSIPSAPTLNVRTADSAPKTLAVRQIDLGTAVQDFNSLVETGKIRNNPATLSKRYHDRTFTGSDKKAIWGSLIAVATGTGATSSVKEGTTHVEQHDDGGVEDDF